MYKKIYILLITAFFIGAIISAQSMVDETAPTEPKYEMMDQAKPAQPKVKSIKDETKTTVTEAHLLIKQQSCWKCKKLNLQLNVFLTMCAMQRVAQSCFHP